MKIRFEGPITVIQQDKNGDNEIEVTSPDLLKQLDEKTHDSELSDYLFDGVGTESLKDLGISGGIIGLSYKDDKMYLYADYFVEKNPDDEQINTLWQEIQGQLADGAGPIFSGDCEDITGLCPLTEFLSVEVNMTED